VAQLIVQGDDFGMCQAVNAGTVTDRDVVAAAEPLAIDLVTVATATFPPH
jgi:hypothetical protein